MPDGVFGVRYQKSGVDLSTAPGATFGGVLFRDMFGSPNDNNCNETLFAVESLTGSNLSQSVTVGTATASVGALTGYIGNVSQLIAGTPGPADFMRVFENGANRVLAQTHQLRTMPPNQNGPLKGETWRAACTGWTPTFLLKDFYVSGDVQLLAQTPAKKAACFISGISGAWSSTRSSGTIQPYAKIYDDPVSKSIKMKVWPDSGTDKVGAYATCIKTL